MVELITEVDTALGNWRLSDLGVDTATSITYIQIYPDISRLKQEDGTVRRKNLACRHDDNHPWSQRSWNLSGAGHCTNHQHQAQHNSPWVVRGGRIGSLAPVIFRSKGFQLLMPP